MMVSSSVTLKNGVEMPTLGLGTFKLRGEDAKNAVSWALSVGYLHIDTASIYKNEVEIGEVIRNSGVPRDKLFITSKASPFEQGYEKALEACNKSLERLKLSYLDLYLIHWPGVAKQDIKSEMNKAVRQKTWEAFEELYRQGKCRAIGVSNYTETHLGEVLSYCKVKPMVNQFEFHPFLAQEKLRNFCFRNEIQPVAYSPLGCGELLKNSLIVNLASNYNKTPAQVLLRWSLQHNLVVIPKSGKQERIAENMDIFNWSLEDSDLEKISQLNENKHFCWSPEGVF